MSRPAQAHDEQPVYLCSGPDTIFGVLTSPPAGAGGVGVLLLPGAVYVLSTNRNRMFVRLARTLAAHGHTVLRIDYTGVGESGGVIGPYALDQPNLGDVRAAAGCLLAHGVDRLVVVGSCFGARAGLHALAGLPQLASLVLLAPPVGDTGRGEAPDPESAGPLFVAHLGLLCRRGIPCLLVYGQDDDYREHFDAASTGPLAPLRRAGSPLRVRILPGLVHGLHRVAVQDALVELIVEWVTGTVAGTGGTNGRSVERC